MLQEERFRSYFLGGGGSMSSANSYQVMLRKIDRALDGLDEAIERQGTEALRRWCVNANVAPFEGDRASDARSILRKYLAFVEQGGETLPRVVDAEESFDVPPEPGIAFRLEHDMQRALRGELEQLEPGLAEADGGREYRVSTGEIDILARDPTGSLVVIELKAGRCPAGALEQVLGYAQALREEREDAGSVRIFLIAAEFSDRMRAAARMIPGVELRTYRFSLRFQNVV